MGPSTPSQTSILREKYGRLDLPGVHAFCADEMGFSLCEVTCLGKLTVNPFYLMLN